MISTMLAICGRHHQRPLHNGVLDHDVHFIATPLTLAAKLRDALA